MIRRISRAAVLGVLTIAVLACSATAAQAVTRYAAPEGAAAGACTTAETACTLVRTIQAFGDTTEVVVLPGNHDIGTASLNLFQVNLHGQGGTTPIPTITSSAPDNPALQIGNAGVRVADLRIKKPAGYPVGISVADASAVVERVYAHASVPNGVGCAVTRGTVRNSVCWSNGTNGYGLGTSQSGAGTYDVTLRNVTAVGSGTGGSGLRFDANTAGVTINVDAKNTIAMSNALANHVRASAVAGASTTIALETSEFSQSTVTGPGTVSVTAPTANGNIQSTPHFVSETSGDFQQRPTSPGVDAGSAAAVSTGDTDLDGQPRIVGPLPDIGADELVEGGPQRYTAPGVDGPEPCVQADPCDIQTAVEGNVESGDEVIVGPGTYLTGSDQLTITEDIHVHGNRGQTRPQITSTNASTVYVNNDATGTDPAPRISDLNISYGSALFGLLMSGGVAERLRVDGPGVSCELAESNSGSPVLRDSVCTSTTPSPDFAAVRTSIDGATTSLKTSRLINVTAVNPAGQAILLWAQNGADLQLDAKNVIAMGTTDVAARTSATPGTSATINTVNSNYDTDATAPNPGATINPTNRQIDPPLLDATYHPLEGSPTINAGASDSALGAFDLDGLARTRGGAPDIGAYEFPSPEPNPDPGPKPGPGPGPGITPGPAKKCKKPKKPATPKAKKKFKKCKKRLRV